MTYTPGLNGGRINATIGGNTAGAGALISTGTMNLMGGNNITLSQNGQSVTISGGAGGGVGIAATGNTAGTMATLTSGTLGLAGGNNITLSQSSGANSTNISIIGPTQSVQTQSVVANVNIAGNTSGTTADVSSGALTLAGGNNITLSQVGNAISVSAPIGFAGGIMGGNTSGSSGTGTLNLALYGGNNITLSGSNFFQGRSITVSGPTMFNAGLSNIQNTAGTSGTASNQLILAGGNNITLSQGTGVNGNTITVVGPYAVLSAGISNLGNTAGTTGTQANKQIMFAGGNNVTLSQSVSTDGFGGASATVSVSAANQTNQTAGIYGVGNTTGQSSSSTVDARSMSFQGTGGVSVGMSGGSVVISGATGGGGLALYDGVGSISSGTASFADANGVSFGFNGQTVTGSVANMFNAGVSTSGSAGNTGTVSNQLVFAGGNNVTLSQSTYAGGASIIVSAPNFGTAAPAAATLSRFEFPDDIFTTLGAAAQGSLSIEHMYVPFYVTGTAMKIGGSLSAATNTSATTASANISLWMGIYSLNGSTLSLASSGSANNGFAWSQTASSSANTSINSMRQMTVPINVNMTPGEWWVAAVMSTATTYTSFGYTMYGNNQIAGAATGAVLTPIGSGTTANRDVVLFQGIYTAATSAGPSSLSGGHINNTAASNVQRAGFYNAIYNATY